MAECNLGGHIVAAGYALGLHIAKKLLVDSALGVQREFAEYVLGLQIRTGATEQKRGGLRPYIVQYEQEAAPVQ